MRSRDDLHLRQHVTEVLAVTTRAACRDHWQIRGNVQRSPLEHITNRRTPFRLDRREIRCVSRVDHLSVDVIHAEKLGNESPQLVESPLRPSVTFLGSIPEPRDPFARMPDMISNFLESFGGNPRELPILRRLKLFENVIAVHIEKELSHHRECKISLWKLDELNVPILDSFPEVRKLIFVAALALCFSGEAQEQRRLSDQIQRDIRESDVLFENWTMTAPLGQTVAQHQAIVAESQEIFDEGGGVAQNPLSPRGTL